MRGLLPWLLRLRRVRIAGGALLLGAILAAAPACAAAAARASSVRHRTGLCTVAPAQRHGHARRPANPCPPLGRPNPLTVSVSTDAGHAVVQLIGADGGTITGAAADGTQFTLVIPQNALAEPVPITLTPITRIGGLPRGSRLIAGVKLSPEGLQFDKLAELTIDSPAMAGVPAGQRQPFGFYGSGSSFYFRPSLGGQSIELQHFSGVGVVRASSAARAAMSGHTPSAAEAAALQDISEVLGAEQFVSALSGRDPAIDENAMADYLESWLGGSLIPHLHAAMGTSDPSVAESAIAEYLRWARTVQLLGLDDRFAGIQHALMSTIRKLLGTGRVKAYHKCTQQHDVPAVRDLLRFYRDAQLLGLPTDDQAVQQELRECLEFELRLRTVDTGYGAGNFSPSRDNYAIGIQADVKLRVEFSRGGLRIYGAGPLVYGAATENEPDLNGYVTFDGATTTVPLQAALYLNLNRPSAPPYLAIRPGIVDESWTEHVNSDPPFTDTIVTHNYGDTFWTLNQAESDAADAAGIALDDSSFSSDNFDYLFALQAGAPGSGMYAHLPLNRQVTFPDSATMLRENATLTVLHTPLAP